MPKVEIKGLKEFRKALLRNPSVSRREISKFIVRGMAVYNRILFRNPWTTTSSGGGIPKDTSNLRLAHKKQIKSAFGRIYINDNQAPYAKYVHGREPGEINSGNGLESRPWFIYAKKKGDPDIKKLYRKMLANITKDLAK